MWQLRQDKYAGIKVNLVLVHCPLWYTFNQEAVANIILADVFARASFKNKDYDDGIRMQIADYNRFLKRKADPLKAQLLYILIAMCMAYLIGQFFMAVMYSFYEPVI